MSPPLYDCLIIGAGPAGSTMARQLVMHGKHVLLLDSKHFPRWKPCGGAIRQELPDVLGFSLSHVVDSEVNGAWFSYEGEKSFASFPENFSFPLVNRERFDALLLKKAIEAGAEFLPGRKITAVQEGRTEVLAAEFQGRQYRCRFLAGADGANSVVRKADGFGAVGRRGFTLSGMPDLPQIDPKTVYFSMGNVEGGYIWIFPKKGFCDAGITGISWDGPRLRRRLLAFLEKFDQHHSLQEMTLRGFPIPYFYGLRNVHTSRILLAGDAASFVDPLTGEGIQYAIKSAILGAETINASLEKGAGHLHDYHHRVNETIGRELAAALELALLYRKYPALCYNTCRKSNKLQEIFTRLFSGRISYVKSFEKLRTNVFIRSLFFMHWLRREVHSIFR